MKRTGDYQVIMGIVWTDEFATGKDDKRCKLTESFGTYERALEAAQVGKDNPAIEHKTSTIIHKPTNTALDIIIVK